MKKAPSRKSAKYKVKRAKCKEQNAKSKVKSAKCEVRKKKSRGVKP